MQRSNYVEDEATGCKVMKKKSCFDSNWNFKDGDIAEKSQ